METKRGATGRTRRERQRDLIIVALVTVALLIPFSGKAFHIDDTLFVWAARHIAEKPFPFYWFDVNWYGSDMAMYQVMKNPPLTSYFIAVAASLLGWSERALHIAFLLPAMGLAVAVYLIAERLTRLALLATLAAIITPVFLVSGTTVMSDVLMLSLWCWAVYLWMKGTDERRPGLLLAAGFLIVLSTLTKYYAMSLVPLLGAYSIYRRDRARLWVPGLVLAIALLAGYQFLTKAVYGRGLLLDAAAYASNVGPTLVGNKLEKLFTGLAFAGGCLATLLFYAGLVCKKRALIAWAVLFVALIPFISRVDALERLLYYTRQDQLDWGYVAQVSLFVTGGLGLLALAARDFMARREAGSLLLLLWVLGTFVFATFVNWTNNGRSNLPMIPAAGILVARAMEERYGARKGQKGAVRWAFYAPLLPALVLSLMVSHADYGLANSARSVAYRMKSRYMDRGERVWFQGHWGFQYYMEVLGARPLDLRTPLLMPGDIVVRSRNNYIVPKLPEYLFNVTLLDIIEDPLPRFVAVMTFRQRAAGFYSSVFGTLPYVLGYGEDDIYEIMRLDTPRAVSWPPDVPLD